MPPVFDEQTICAIVRTRLKDADASRRSRVIWAIPQAFDALARAVANNPRKRAMLTTERDSNSFSLAGDGSLDLEAGILLAANQPQILIEYLKYGTIWFVPSAVTFTVDYDANTIHLSNGTGYANGDILDLTTTGVLPYNLSPGAYYLVNYDPIAGTGQLSLTSGGTPIVIKRAVVVTVAGNTSVRGTYIQNGTYLSHPDYVLVGHESYTDGQYAIRRNAASYPNDWWEIHDNSDNLEYVEDPDGDHHDTPDLVTTWSNDPTDFGCDGASPTPVVTNYSSGTHTATPRLTASKKLEFLSNPDYANMPQTLGDSYRYYWLDRYKLRTIPLTTEAGPLVGKLYFAVPFQPTMADFAYSSSGFKLAELHEDLIKKVIEIVTGPGEED